MEIHCCKAFFRARIDRIKKKCIRELSRKDGVSYRITVSLGRDIANRQIRKYMTWSPEPGINKKQIEKEIARIAFDFERKCQQGYEANDKQSV